MKDLYNKILASLDNHNLGFSARKLSALVVMIMVVVAHAKWLSLGNLSQLEMVLTIDYGFISVCLGMTTYESIKKKQQDETK